MEIRIAGDYFIKSFLTEGFRLRRHHSLIVDNLQIERSFSVSNISGTIILLAMIFLIAGLAVLTAGDLHDKRGFFHPR